MLSILIPTYNRNEKVLRLLKKIDIINKEYKFPIVVIDNHSDIPLEKYLLESNYFISKEITLIRNNGNVGLGGNLLNCFLNCKTEWMWLLGDDDLPTEDSLNKILVEIRKTNDSDFLIKFNSTAGQFPLNNQKINSLETLIEFNSNFGYYSNMLFISNSIFRVKAILPETFYMANSLKTMAPHLVGVYRCVEKGFSIKIVTEHIIEHGIAVDENDKWEYERLINGMLYFIDADIHLQIKRTLLPKLFVGYYGGEKNFYKGTIFYPYLSRNNNRDYWSYFLLKSATLFKGFRFYYLIFLGLLIRSKFVNWTMKTVLKKYLRKTTNSDVFRN